MVADEQVNRSASPQTGAGPEVPRYRFREGIWDVICEQMGWPNTFSASKALRVSDTTITRGLAGYPGDRLMAAVMHALPRSWKFEHVFELAPPPASPGEVVRPRVVAS